LIASRRRNPGPPPPGPSNETGPRPGEDRPPPQPERPEPFTPGERRRPELIKGSRRLRIARGSGTSVQQVNQLVKQFDQMRKLMRQIGQGKMPDIGALMRQAR